MSFDETGRQRRLLGLLASGRQLSMIALAMEGGFEPGNTAKAVGMLVLRGFVERSAGGAFSATAEGIAFHESGEAFRPGPVGPRKTLRTPSNNLRQRAWTGMRILKRFVVDDLVTCAAAGSDKHPHNSINKYLRVLCKAGIVARLPKRAPGTAPTSNGSAVYWLVRDIGEQAPAIKRDGTLVDRNEVAA